MVTGAQTSFAWACALVGPGVATPLTLGDDPLAQVDTYRYLGVLITSNLVWSTHIMNICNKTRRLIGILYRQFYKYSSPDTMLRMYSSFIQPHLEYAMASWDPFLKKDIELLENVQKFALRVCTKQWDADYSTSLETSEMTSLESRRVNAKLCHQLMAEYSTTPAELCITEPLYPSSVALCSSKVHFFPARSLHGTHFLQKLLPFLPLHHLKEL